MKKLFLFSIALFYTFNSIAQCTGQLGENIFENGDFGSGTTNIPPNPNIAPGYNYDTNPSLDDGEYCITNNTFNWPNLWTTWLPIGDNSSDPNGYMMVVNASFAEGLFFTQEVTGLCENTTYEFSADIINIVKASVSNHIKPNISFLLDNSVELNTGEVPQDETWHTYSFTFTTSVGQNSATLSLRNNAPGGIGNDLALDNISFRPCGPEIDITSIDDFKACNAQDVVELNASLIGQQYDNPVYQWQLSINNIDWTDISGENNPILDATGFSENIQYFRVLVSNSLGNLINSKCRIISDPTSVIIEDVEVNIQDTICEGAIYTFGNQMLTIAGNYSNTYTTTIGCDSTVNLELFVQKIEVNIQDTICQGLSYPFGNQTLTTTGNYSHVYTTTTGCDSTVNLELFVQEIEVNTQDTICEGTTYTFGDQMLTTTGNYSHVYTTIIGCDSTVNLALTVIPNDTLDGYYSTAPPSCHDLDDAWFVLDSITGGYNPYQILLNNEPINIQDSINLTAGDFTLSITDRFNCQDNSSFSIQAPFPFYLDVPDFDNELDLGDSVLITAYTSGPTDTFLWSINPDQEWTCLNLNCSQVSIYPLTDIGVQLSTTSLTGCSKDTSFNITVNTDIELYIPNIFSPNDDGENDFFTFYGNSRRYISIQSLTIFNRWGGVLYKGIDLPLNGLGWDGYYNGEMVGEGTYIFVAEVLLLNGEQKLVKGDIELVR